MRLRPVDVSSDILSVFVFAMVVDPPGVMSDHSLIKWSLPLGHQPPITVTREVRGWRKLDKDKFRSALLESSLCNETCQPEAPDELF